MLRTFLTDVLVCPRCSGTRKVLAAIHDPDSIARVLAALGPDSAVPEMARRFRLGNGGWATLHAGTGLRVGKSRLPAGIWYLGLERAADGGWSLAVFETAKVLRHGVMPGNVRGLEPALRLPMTLTSVAVEPGAEVAHEELELRLIARPGPIRLDAEPLGTAELSIRWGRHCLKADVIADIELAQPPAAGKWPEFRALAPERVVETPSGLRYEVVRDGVGTRPDRQSLCAVHYAIWLADGTQIDLANDPDATRVLRSDQVIPGLAEGLQLMSPGMILLLEVPAKLGYGPRGVGNVPPDAALYIFVELRYIAPK